MRPMSRRWRQYLAGLLSRIKRRFDAADLDTGPALQRHGPVRWEALDDDPSFRLRFTLSPGVYRLRVNLRIHHIQAQPTHGITQIYLDEGQGESEAASWLLPFRSGEIAEGTFEVKQRSACRWDPMEHAGHFDLVDLEIQRIHPDQARHLAALSSAQAYRQNHPPLMSYAAWLRATQVRSAPVVTSSRGPAVGICLQGRSGDAAAFMRTMDSVWAQTHPDWHLYGVELDDRWAACPAPWRARWEQDPRFHPRPATPKAGVSEGWSWWLTEGDQLAPKALAAVVHAIESQPQAQMVYTDQDFVDVHGFRCDPYFKPDWSPELFEHFHYTGRATVWHRSLWCDWAEPWSVEDPIATLNTSVPKLLPENVVHCPLLAYHQAWVGLPASDTSSLAAAVGACLPRVAQGDRPRHPLVSIIIPTRDARHLLEQCIASIQSYTTYPAYEVIVVDNGSSEPETFAYFGLLQSTPGLQAKVLRVDGPFNYSAINNAAVNLATGEVLVFLNNDIEITTPDWLEELVYWATRPGVGCVGAKLHFPDRRIQHAGIVLGMGGVAGHAHRGEPSDSMGYVARLTMPHNVSAVTGAAMAVQKSIFERAGRFDEAQLPVAYNDVDLCLKIRALGYRNVFTPFAEMVHHESATRGQDTDPVKRQRLAKEEAVVRQRWGHIIQADPMYNPQLSLRSEHLELAAP